MSSDCPPSLGDNDCDIANVSISVSMPLLNVIRLPQHRHYNDTMWWRNPCAIATTNVSASLLVDCHKSDPGLVVGGVTTLSIRWYCTLISKYALLCSCHQANYTALLI